MRKLTAVLAGWFLIAGAVGCSNMNGERRWGGCALGGGLLGAALGGVGGGLGVSEYENGPDNNERAAGAGVGALTGALIGTLLGHYTCDPVEAPPPPPPVAQAPPPPPPAKGTKLATVGAAHFDFNKAQLKTGGEEDLGPVVRMMGDQKDLRVVVEGHTDSVGSDAYNQKLSERRAEAVKSYLVRRGIDASRIRTRGLGETRPVASNSTEAGRAQNRRAEVIAD
jgi:OOP family OmpA-OmpF porin